MSIDKLFDITNFDDANLPHLIELLRKICNEALTGGTIRPDSMADTDAENNLIYYSTTQSKLVYKTSAGVVKDLHA